MSEWISVDERLPKFIGRGDRSEAVLIMRDTGDGTATSYTISFRWSEAMIMSADFNDAFSIVDRWSGQESKGYRVTHWMPLPPPPESAQ